MKLFYFILVVTFICHAQDTTFKTVRNLPLIQVQVDGQNKLLVFDTGAERTMIHDPKVTAERAEFIVVSGKTLKMLIIHTNMNWTDLYKVHGADGILGQDVMRQFKRAKIDYTKSTIELE